MKRIRVPVSSFILSVRPVAERDLVRKADGHPSSVLRVIAGLFLAAILLAGCGQNSTGRDTVPPSPPTWVHRSGDGEPDQRGIHPEPTTSEVHYWVHLEWNANPEPDVVEYRIWRRSEMTPIFTRYAVADLRIGENPETPYGALTYSWVDRGDSVFGYPADVLAPDHDTGETRGYLWNIEALDSAGNRSTLSDSVYYRLMNNPENLLVLRTSPNVYTASWTYVTNPNEYPSYFILRVYPERYGPDSVLHAWMTSPYNVQNSCDMHLDSLGRSLTSGANYVCQVNIVANHASPVHSDSLCGAAVKYIFVYQD